MHTCIHREDPIDVSEVIDIFCITQKQKNGSHLLNWL